MTTIGTEFAMNNVKHKNIRCFFFVISFCLLLTAYFLFSSCGKKGDPTLKSYEKPDPPSGLAAIHRESEIILSWEFPKDKEPSLRGFHIFKSSDGDFKKIAFLDSDKRSYTDTNFQTGSVYKYKVLSRNLKDVTSNDSQVLEVMPAGVPSPPDSLFFSVEYDSLTIRWKISGEGILYNVYKSDKKGIYSLMPANKEPLKETSFRDTFDINKVVYYTVRSLRGGSIRDEGPSSEEINIDPSEFVPSAPAGLQAVPAKERIYLIWKEPPETWIVGYRVYREMDKEGGFKFIGESRTPSFIDKDNPSVKRNYRVTAMGPSKEGPSAEIRNISFVKQR